MYWSSPLFFSYPCPVVIAYDWYALNHTCRTVYSQDFLNFFFVSRTCTWQVNLHVHLHLKCICWEDHWLHAGKEKLFWLSCLYRRSRVDDINIYQQGNKFVSGSRLVPRVYSGFSGFSTSRLVNSNWIIKMWTKNLSMGWATTNSHNFINFIVWFIYFNEVPN